MSIFQGTSLRVDLSGPEIHRDVTPENGIGGRTWNSVTLLRELKPGIDPLGPENLLCISVGPLTGSEFAATCRFIASAKSPLTGILGDSGARGFFAPELRWAGIDQIVFSGISERWVYLHIDDDQVELRDASHLVGMDITETTVQLMDELGDPDLQVAAIGPAGENLVKYAIISCNLSRACGRTGMGAVMGSKRVKAIVVRGSKPARPADPDRFKKACGQLISNIEAHRQFRSRQLYGTTRIMDALSDMGVLPAYPLPERRLRGPREGQLGGAEAGPRGQGEGLLQLQRLLLPVQLHEVQRGRGPRVRGAGGFYGEGAAARIWSWPSTSRTWSTAWGWTASAPARSSPGSWSAGTRGSSPMRTATGWTSPGARRMPSSGLPEMIANREGIGDLLAEGTRTAAKKFGTEARTLTAEVKGLELFSADPRGIKGYGLMNAVNSRGGDHYRGEPMIELTGDEELALRRVGNRNAAHRLSEEGKGALVNYAEHMGLLSDSMTICKNISCCMDVVDFELAAEAYSGFLGRDITPLELWEVCSHVSQVERDFNLREGLRVEDDTLPERFIGKPIPDGPSKGTVIDIDRLVGDYYEVKGWKR